MLPTMMINISDSHYQLWSTKVTNFCGIKPPRSIKFIDCFTSGGRTISGRTVGRPACLVLMCVWCFRVAALMRTGTNSRMLALLCGYFLWVCSVYWSIWLIKSSSHPSSSIICPMSGCRCPLPSLMLLGFHHVYITQLHFFI